MRALSLAVLLAILVAPAWGEDDPWALERPASAPRGEAVTLRYALEPGTSHAAKAVHEQTGGIADQVVTVRMELATHVRRTDGAEDEPTEVGGEIAITRLRVDEDDLSEDAGPAAAAAYVVGTLTDRRSLDRCRSVGTGNLGPFGQLLQTLPAWVLPLLPERPVKVGEVWDVPAAYVLWNVGQLVPGVAPSGASFRTLEAIEDRGGARCARLRTATSVRFDLERGHPALGEGKAVLRVKVEMTDWVGLDGYLRASQVTLHALGRSDATGMGFEFRATRSVEAGPAPTPSTGLGAKDWTPFFGKLPFVVGHERGMEEARFTGRAPMFFVTSYGSGGGRHLARTAFTNDKVVKLLEGYTPILIDADVEGEAFMEGREVVPLDPTLLWEDLDGGTVFTMSGGLPEIPGIDAEEMLGTMFDIPSARTPEARPSPAYAELLGYRDRLREARKLVDRKATIAALAQIRAVGKGRAVQREADEADVDLRRYADSKKQEAEPLLRSKGTRARGLLVLEALAKELEGHPLAQDVRQALEAAKSSR